MTALDPVLAGLSYETIEMLRAFPHYGSFKELALQFHRDERTVSKTLLELDHAFHASKEVHILEREPGRKGYRLTPDGLVFVSLLEQVTSAARSAVDGVTSTNRIRIPCTSNCLSYFHKLREALPPTRSFDLVPLPRRSAELDRGLAERSSADRGRYPIWLSSALMSADQRPAKGDVCSINEDIEVLPLELDRMKALANEDLGLSNSTSVRELIESGITLLVPSGGAAWQFLNRSYRDWYVLRPFQHIDVPHLDYGLKCLANRLVPRSAMVVHGVEVPIPGVRLDTPRLYEFNEVGAHQYVAATGVFRDKSVLSEPSGTTEPFEIIWRTATEHLPEGERLF